jgi:hypothetical protein
MRIHNLTIATLFICCLLVVMTTNVRIIFTWPSHLFIPQVLFNKQDAEDVNLFNRRGAFLKSGHFHIYCQSRVDGLYIDLQQLTGLCTAAPTLTMNTCSKQTQHEGGES